MVIYKALRIITCHRLNICRQELFTEVEMLEIIVYKTSCFFTLGISLDFMIQNPFPSDYPTFVNSSCDYLPEIKIFLSNCIRITHNSNV